MTQTTMVVTVIPRVYDWIDDNSDYEDTQIGSSVTFGSVTWMDRNLGQMPMQQKVFKAGKLRGDSTTNSGVVFLIT